MHNLPWATGYLLYSIVSSWATLGLPLGYPWATFVCSPRVAQGQFQYNKIGKLNGQTLIEIAKCFHGLFSNPKMQSRFHVFMQPWATFVCSPK